LDEYIQKFMPSNHTTNGVQQKSLFAEFQLFIFAGIITLVLLCLAFVLGICFKDKVTELLKKVKAKMMWNGLIRIYQMNFLKFLINPLMHIQKEDGGLTLYYIIIGVMSILALYSHIIL
jgi:hypothetical protein